MTPRSIHLPFPARLRSRRVRGVLSGFTVMIAVVMAVTLVGVQSAAAGPAPVGLGTAASFAVLGGSTVTNTGPSVISGSVGVSPGSAVVGFPPGIVNNGTIHRGDAVAAQAQGDLTTAYNDAAGRSSTATTPLLGGRTLVAGVYTGPTLALTGVLTLDGQNDPTSVFIFQSASTLITASNSKIMLINGASACNVFFQVGSSATLGTGSTFVGNILALTSITAQTGATVQGRLLARNGAVTLDTNTITLPDCSVATPTSTATSPTSTATSSSTSSKSVVHVAASGSTPGPGAPHTGGAGGGNPLNGLLAMCLIASAVILTGTGLTRRLRR